MAGKRGKKGGFSKKVTQYLIYVVMASFILGGLFTNYGIQDDEQQDNNPESNYNILSYDGERISSEPVECTITAKKNQVKLVLAQDAQINQQDLKDVFESDIEGVKSILLELSQSSAMFDMQIEDSETKQRIQNKISLPGARLYDVYECERGQDTIELIGTENEVGDTVNAILMERTRAGFSEVIGFQNKQA